MWKYYEALNRTLTDASVSEDIITDPWSMSTAALGGSNPANIYRCPDNNYWTGPSGEMCSSSLGWSLCFSLIPQEYCTQRGHHKFFQLDLTFLTGFLRLSFTLQNRWQKHCHTSWTLSCSQRNLYTIFSKNIHTLLCKLIRVPVSEQWLWNLLSSVC